jgi:hypothetical protein
MEERSFLSRKDIRKINNNNNKHVIPRHRKSGFKEELDFRYIENKFHLIA